MVVFGELLRRGYDVYLTLVDDQQIDCIVRFGDRDPKAAGRYRIVFTNTNARGESLLTIRDQYLPGPEAIEMVGDPEVETCAQFCYGSLRARSQYLVIGHQSALPMVLVGLIVTVFLLFEARRYRYFNVWRARARLLETDFYAPMIRGEGIRLGLGWTELLAKDYCAPRYHINFARAIGRRLRRTYAWIFVIQAVAYYAIRRYLRRAGKSLW